ncbi:hypothetical protein [Flexivirga meconopsidis]|uniref:hypothetical protein n=1 Tax=Flexivirga meconopsidis TaxID=2977121 RepID=UPI00223FD17D|nr:hypothetical protein [Flexivirga meconopsidis]
MSTQEPVLPGSDAADRSRVIAIVVALIGLVGMFVALLGWTGMMRDVDKTIGIPPWVIFVVGAVITVGAALFDLAAGSRSDVFAVAPGQQLTALQFTLNKLAPWIIVLLTLVGMLIIWLRYR